MAKLRFRISISLDGYVAGPGQSKAEPLGKGGEQLHEWALALDEWRRAHGREGGETNASSAVVRELQAGIGATIMGRNMFGGGPGPWGDERWQGWWGEEPPFHHPVFVLTHHEREPLELGETTFTFVTDGIESALEQAKTAAAGGDVALAGGGEAGREYLAAGLVDEMVLHLVPILLGGGARLFDDIDPAAVALEQTEVVDAPGVAHLKYRRVR